MRNILISGLIGSIITGCVIITNDSPSATPSVSPSPAISPIAKPSVSSTPSPSVIPVPTGSVSAIPASVSPIPSSGSGGGGNVPIEKGILQGRLTIGPLCPVEPCNLSDDQKRQAYESRKIQIYLPDEKTLVTEFVADYQTGDYSEELPFGNYTVIVTNAGKNFTPRPIIIESHNVTELNINIDTGIR